MGRIYNESTDIGSYIEIDGVQTFVPEILRNVRRPDDPDILVRFGLAAQAETLEWHGITAECLETGEVFYLSDLKIAIYQREALKNPPVSRWAW